MSADWTWWPTNPADLAVFTVPDEYQLMRGAGRELPLPVIERAGFAYTKLLDLRLDYDGPLYTWNLNGQTIRQPYQMVETEKRGNCLDLSVAFAGLCLQLGLRPLIALLGLQEGPHAIVVLPDARIDQDETVLIWGRVPTADGLGKPTPDQVRENLARRWLAVEPTALTPLPFGRRLGFEDACAKGREALLRSDGTTLVDVGFTLHVTNRPVREVDRSLVARPAPKPSFGDEVRLRYAGRLAAQPAAWDVGGLEEIAFDRETQDHALTAPALLRALRAKAVYQAIGGTPGLRHARWFFYEATDRVVDTQSPDVLLVEAALTGYDRVPDSLTEFLLRVAAYHGAGLGNPALNAWVMEHGLEREAAEFLRDCKRRYWALIFLGEETIGADRDGPIRLCAVVEPKPVGLLEAADGDGSYIDHALVKTECRSPEELPGKLHELIRDLQKKLENAPMVIDLVAPLRFLTEGLEHQSLVPLPTGYREPLSRQYEPRLRWVRHVLDPGDRQRQKDRAGRAKAAWQHSPPTLSPDEAGSFDAVSAWLADEANAKRPCVLAVEDETVRTEALGWLLAAGCGYIVWHRPGGVVQITRRHWEELEAHQRREMLPEKLLNGGNGANPPSIIWNDPTGRPGFDLPLARLQNPPEESDGDLETVSR
ncbi:hypothetical protein [Actinomadura mexicana]|uniref:Uncharacterized protein n=1 Tax=Actinomadura mexicana TaxID=134959 RepID=A0A238UP03_9ACTN|nr:hypothetical protein [Actinomadura mexicana]SNR23243.1 hypothetical protein SAMN06265355_101123 [Actinomadura mexicana]